MKISPILQQLALDGIATDPRSLPVIDKMEPGQIETRANLLREGKIDVKDAIKKYLPT